MTIEEFRIKHSMLIEQYQFIEFHLEGIFGLLEDGDFEELTKRVINDTMGELIRKVRFLIKEKKLDYLNFDDFKILDDIRDDRNYWCHSCYLEMKVAKKKIQNIDSDLKKVTSMNQKLKDTFITIKNKH